VIYKLLFEKILVTKITIYYYFITFLQQSVAAMHVGLVKEIHTTRMNKQNISAVTGNEV